MSASSYALVRAELAAGWKARAPLNFGLHKGLGAFHISSMPTPPRRPSPPHNPGLRALVEGKRDWDARDSKENQREGFRGWHERGYLPHRDAPGLTQFITYHLADAFPVTLRSEWSALLEVEDDRERRKQLEEYLDRGRGECWLRRPDIAALCENAFRHFDGERYELKAWCVMPNHVHALFKVTSVPMSECVQSWKGYTGRRGNELLQRAGQEFWGHDYWDTFMRDEAHERQTVRYIENNPVKAGLVLNSKEWPWSSARFRDEYDVLKLPPR
jgi:putative transposase